ncbi:SDR family NAD(P)-dependent oxidoreductase [Streptomyces sp. DG1A-41]|uniref:SDR family NAD(P)-dependent oxidoreductase n=1 Tax=Streptomyces sp. DG1A-41 TaxID=3125779 RepID=UPI0030D136C3
MLEPADASGRRTATVHGRAPGGTAWTEHAAAVLAPADGTPPAVAPGPGRDSAVLAPAARAAAAAGPDPALRARGAGRMPSAPHDGRHDSAPWPPADARPVEPDEVYEQLARRGYHYGPTLRGLRRAWVRGHETFAEVALGQDAAGGTYATAHPALLDAALHAALLGTGDTLDVPFTWRDVTLPPSAARTLRVRVTAGETGLSVFCTDEQGRPAAIVGSLVLRPLTGTTGHDDGATSLELTWARAAVDDLAPLTDWATLDAPGLRAARDFPGLETVPASVPSVLVAQPQVPQAAATPLPATVERLTGEVTDLLQKWLGDDRFTAARLAVVTRRALDVTGNEPLPGLAASAVSGLVRAAQAEHPGLLQLVDIDDDPASAAALPVALALEEPETAIRQGRVYVPALRPPGDGRLPVPQGHEAWRLDVTAKGTLDNLALVPHPEATRSLGPREIRIEVRAAGLNFRDIAVGLGLVASEKTMGSEGAGVVTEVGAEVTRTAVGDRVFGVFERSLGPVAVADERMVRRVPDGWSDAQAASVPIVFITAYQCLVDVAAVRPGESVLVHTATGGVGLAALQLARHFGADVFATAGPAKHGILREWGVPDGHIASSRSLDFEHEFRAATAGRGVDVVLNSLAHGAVDASLRLLAPGGRFAEMGKTDIRDTVRIQEQYPGVTYRAYNILGVAPERIGEVLDELIALFRDGALVHLPLRTWDVREGQRPLRMLSRAKQHGKLALSMPRVLDTGRPVLVTGGADGLGAVLTRHLVTAHGAREVVLLSRRGPDAPGAAALVAKCAGLGATAHVLACDVTDRNALAKVIAEHTPGSVFHTAGVLDDGLIGRMTPARLRAVLAPKAHAAWHLHELTRDLDLSAFVLFSSAVGVIGGPGQANYAAANAFLDALAQHRRTEGLPATSVAWGLWEDRTGMTAHLTDMDVTALAAIGIAPMATGSALRLLDEALASPRPAVTVFSPVPDRVRPGSRAAALFRALRDVSPRAGDAPLAEAAAPGTDGPARPAAPSTGRTAGGLVELVCAQAAEVLGYTEAVPVAPTDSFKELGFDSLLSVDLRNRLNAATGLRMPAEAVLNNATPEALAEYMAAARTGERPGAPETTA